MRKLTPLGIWLENESIRTRPWLLAPDSLFLPPIILVETVLNQDWGNSGTDPGYPVTQSERGYVKGIKQDRLGSSSASLYL